MKKNYKNDNSVKKQKVAEPVVSYQPKSTIKIFKSFEAAKQDEIDFFIKQSPIERIKHTVALILRVFNITHESLRERKRNNTIRVIKTE